MPITVPRLPSESPEGFPSARVDAGAPVSAFGGGAGNVAARIDTSGIADITERIAQHEKQKADTIAYTNASAKLSDLETTLRVQAHQAQGSNAFGLPETVQQSWKDGTAEIAKSMANDTQKLAFQNAERSHWSSLNEAVQMHVADQRKVYAGQVYDGYLAAESNAAIAAYNDPDRVALSIDRRKAAITDFSASHGIAPELRDKQIAQMTSDTHTDVITRMLNATPDGEPPQMAADYYRAHQADIIGTEAIKLGGLIGKKTVEGVAQQQGDAIFDKSLTLDDGLKQARDIQDPTVRNKVEERLRRSFEDKATSQRQAQRQTVIELNDMLHANGGDFDKLPIEMRDQLTPNEEESMRRNADQIRNPKQRTNMGTKASLLNMAGLHPDDFTKLDLTQYRDQFSPTDYSAMLNKQLTMRTSDTHHERTQTEAVIRKNAAADAKAEAVAKKREEARKTLEAMGVHLSPTVPGAPIAKPNQTPGQAPKAAVPPDIDKLNVPQSWKDHAATNPAYAEYLRHHSTGGEE